MDQKEILLRCCARILNKKKIDIAPAWAWRVFFAGTEIRDAIRYDGAPMRVGGTIYTETTMLKYLEENVIPAWQRIQTERWRQMFFQENREPWETFSSMLEHDEDLNKMTTEIKKEEDGDKEEIASSSLSIPKNNDDDDEDNLVNINDDDDDDDEDGNNERPLFTIPDVVEIDSSGGEEEEKGKSCYNAINLDEIDNA